MAMAMKNVVIMAMAMMTLGVLPLSSQAHGAAAFVTPGMDQALQVRTKAAQIASPGSRGLSSMEGDQGYPGAPRGRELIVRGKSVADYRYFAYHVAVLFDGEYSCGGSIIAPAFVLTAAHCVYRGFNQSAPGGGSWNLRNQNFTVDVVYGSLSLSSPQAKVMRASEVWIHPKYVIVDGRDGSRRTKGRLSHDFAILKLVRPVQYSDTVRSITLAPDDSMLRTGADLTMAGWGSTANSSGPPPPSLQTVIVDHLPDVCAKRYRSKAYNFIPEWNISLWYDEDIMLCAGCRAAGKGSCIGDSGSPLTIRSSNGGCPVEVGPLNWLVLVNEACGIYTPDKYARAGRVLPWIESVVGQPVRSTVVPRPTMDCDDCDSGSDPRSKAPAGDCMRAQMYDLNLCDVQAHLASSFILMQPRCEGGKYTLLKAYIDFQKGFANVASVTEERLKKGHVVFFRSRSGTGHSTIRLEDSFYAYDRQRATLINTPLKRPCMGRTKVAFSQLHGGWLYKWPGCSSKYSYAAVYVLENSRGKPMYCQISLPVGRVSKY